MKTSCIKLHHNNISFNANKNLTSLIKKSDLDLVNESKFFDKQIKDLLIELISEDSFLSKREIKKRLNLNIDINGRINKNNELKKLWEVLTASLVKQSENLYNKIKLFLEDAIETKTPIRIIDVAQSVGLTKTACYNRIHFTPELKELFDKVEKQKVSIPSEESLNINKQIKEIIENAILNKTHLLSRDIAKTLGLNREQVLARISRYSELKELWSKIEHNKNHQKTDASKQKDNIVKNIIEKAIKDKRKMSLVDLVKETGFTRTECNDRIYTNNDIKELWQKVNTKAKVADENEIIKTLLLSALETKEYLSYTEMTKKTGMSKNIIHGKIWYSQELNELWQKVKENNRKSGEHKKRVIAAQKNKKPVVTKEESAKINETIISLLKGAVSKDQPISNVSLSQELGITPFDVSRRLKLPQISSLWKQNNEISKNKKNELLIKIQKFLENAIHEDKKLSVDDVARHFDITKGAATHKLCEIPILSDLWNKIEHSGGVVAQERSKELNNKILNYFEQAIKNNTPVTIGDVAKELGLSKNTIKGRLKAYPELREKWDMVPKRKVYVERKSSKESTLKIQETLENSLKNNQPIMLTKLAKELGFKSDSLRGKIYSTPILKSLWNQVEKTKVTDDSKAINSNIKTILEMAIKDKTYLSYPEIAQKLSIPQELCMRRLNKSQDLFNLWKQVQNFRLEDVKIIDTKIKQILEECLANNINIERDELINKSGINPNTVKYRLYYSEELKDLWKKIKSIDVNIIKQINELKKDNLDDENIKRLLKIDDSKFNSMISKYKSLKTVYEKYNKNNISKEEFINWGLLSKREFELALNELFSKIGYESKTTRYSHDNGIDIAAIKDGKKTFIECMHSLYFPVDLMELLTLQGNKHYYKADNVIYVASSGITEEGKIYADKLGKDFKVLDLPEIITLAKKYYIDITALKEKENVNLIDSRESKKNWFLPSKLSKEENKKWRTMKPEVFERKVEELLTSQGYAVRKADELHLSDFYIIKKGEHTSIIKCQNQNSIPSLDSIKALYGLKDFYNADDVILIGTPGISSFSKNFIDTINRQKETKNTYKLCNLDKIINLYNKIFKS